MMTPFALFHHLPDITIEVADVSLSYDRGQKASTYAASGIPALWIVNLLDHRIEVLTAPDPTLAGYQRQRLAFA